MTELKYSPFLVGVTALLVLLSFSPALSMSMDIRGPWVGSAKGAIFGAEGTVNIVRQLGEDIFGIVEGGNMFGRARFTIEGKIRGNHVSGSKQGHTFEGFVYPDGSIRGLFRTSDGDTYNVLLHRPYSYWGVPYGMW